MQLRYLKVEFVVYETDWRTVVKSGHIYDFETEVPTPAQWKAIRQQFPKEEKKHDDAGICGDTPCECRVDDGEPRFAWDANRSRRRRGKKLDKTTKPAGI